VASSPSRVGSDGVDVALVHDDVELSGDFHLGLVGGVEEDPVALLDGAGVGTDGEDARPGEPPAAHRSGRGDNDAAAGAALAGVGVDLDQDPVVEHLDGCLLGHPQLATLRTTTNNTTAPRTPPTVLRMLSVRGSPVPEST